MIKKYKVIEVVNKYKKRLIEINKFVLDNI